MTLENPQIGDRCRIGGAPPSGVTKIDPLTWISGLCGEILRFGEQNGQRGAFIALDEPVSDCFGDLRRVVIVEPEHLESEF